MRDTILVLEDQDERLARFRDAVRRMNHGLRLRTWSDAHMMIRELAAYLATAAVVSLDHDLYPETEHAPDPGDGLDVARYLAGLAPTCPVIVHSSNVDRADQMEGMLSAAGWEVHRIGPLGDDWIEGHWAQVVEGLLGSCEP